MTAAGYKYKFIGNAGCFTLCGDVALATIISTYTILIFIQFSRISGISVPKKHFRPCSMQYNILTSSPYISWNLSPINMIMKSGKFTPPFNTFFC